MIWVTLKWVVVSQITTMEEWVTVWPTHVTIHTVSLARDDWPVCQMETGPLQNHSVNEAERLLLYTRAIIHIFTSYIYFFDLIFLCCQRMTLTWQLLAIFRSIDCCISVNKGGRINLGARRKCTNMYRHACTLTCTPSTCTLSHRKRNTSTYPKSDLCVMGIHKKRRKMLRFAQEVVGFDLFGHMYIIWQ